MENDLQNCLGYILYICYSNLPSKHFLNDYLQNWLRFHLPLKAGAFVARKAVKTTATPRCPSPRRRVGPSVLPTSVVRLAAGAVLGRSAWCSAAGPWWPGDVKGRPSMIPRFVLEMGKQPVRVWAKMAKGLESEKIWGLIRLKFKLH